MRHGAANLFLRSRNGLRWAFELLGGWREVQATERRQGGDWAHFVRDLADGRHKDADKIVLVVGQPDIHSPASLCEAFPPPEARRVATARVRRTSRTSWRSATPPSTAHG